MFDKSSAPRRQRVTSRYDVVVHEVTTQSAKLWIGALSPSIAKPNNWRLIVRKMDKGFGNEGEQGEIVNTIEHLADDVWQRPFDKLHKRFYAVEMIDLLLAGTDYQIDFEARVNNEWKHLESAFFSTLPKALPTNKKNPFTVAIGSCFYTKHDGGMVGQSYEALYKSKKFKPDIKFLAGDQVYVDIGLGLFPLDKEDCQDRIADDYAESWALMRSMLRRGGTWMLPDDHEYWNNYPFLDGFNPYLITLEHDDDFRNDFEDAALQAVRNIEQIKTTRFIDIGEDLSFCVADLRTERTREYFVSPPEFAKIIDWIGNLKSPGVLVIPQPLIATKGNKDDANLPDWDQYTELLKAMEAANHDIVVLTGDVHYGRVAQVMIGKSDNKLVEVITSPLSNLSEIDGIAATGPELPKTDFPMMDIAGVQGNEVDYLGKVSTIDDFWDWRFPKERTTEHFMTVDFYRSGNKVKMKIHAWNARKFSKSTGLPKRIKNFNISEMTLK